MYADKDVDQSEELLRFREQCLYFEASLLKYRQNVSEHIMSDEEQIFVKF